MDRISLSLKHFTNLQDRLNISEENAFNQGANFCDFLNMQIRDFIMVLFFSKWNSLLIN